MRILLAGFANSIHIQRLREYLEYAGHTVAVASWQDSPHCDYKLNPKPPLPGKLSYFAMLSDLQKAIHKFHPDLLHAHNATSYGSTGSSKRVSPIAHLHLGA